MASCQILQGHVIDMLRRACDDPTIFTAVAARPFADTIYPMFWRKPPGRGDFVHDGDATMNRPAGALKVHPLSVAIYGEQSADAGLVESIEAWGVLVPLAIKADGTTIG